MSIIIKDMEMPTQCKGCVMHETKLHNRGTYDQYMSHKCKLTKTEIHKFDTRLENCPLKEVSEDA